MTLFFLTFFSLYSLLHLYLLFKARSTFSLAWRHIAVVIPFLVLMVLSPAIIRLLEKNGLDGPARFLSYIGYTWMGLLLLFCSISLPLDILRFVCDRGKLFGSSLISPYIQFMISSSLSIIIAFYGYFEAKDIRIERHTIRTPKVSERIRIVQVSDVHIGLIIRAERVKKIADMVKKEKPDIVVSTGDLVDGQINSLSGISDILSEINPGYGKFAITGNHEFYAGLDQAIEFTEKSGFRVLRGEGITLPASINIAGVDDPAGKAYGNYIYVSERDLLSSLPRKKFTILLKHRPVVERDSIGLFDLQLSGHTHKGQIFPFSILTWLYYPVHAGSMNVTDNSYLYVSRGTGTWGPPIRFLSPPEIAVIDIVPHFRSTTDNGSTEHGTRPPKACRPPLPVLTRYPSDGMV